MRMIKAPLRLRIYMKKFRWQPDPTAALKPIFVLIKVDNNGIIYGVWKSDRQISFLFHFIHPWNVAFERSVDAVEIGIVSHLEMPPHGTQWKRFANPANRLAGSSCSLTICSVPVDKRIASDLPFLGKVNKLQTTATLRCIARHGVYVKCKWWFRSIGFGVLGWWSIIMSARSEKTKSLHIQT